MTVTIVVHPVPFEPGSPVPGLKATVATREHGAYDTALYLRGGILPHVDETLWYYMSEHVGPEG